MPLKPPTNGMVQQHSGKPVYEGIDRNGGKFSVSSLLHASGGRLQDGVKQEPANNGESPHHVMHHLPAAHHRFSAIHKSLLSSAAVAPMPPGIQPRGLGELLSPASVLPYFAPDMTLRLNPNSSAQDGGGGGGMPPAHHQFYLKQGPSKCESCNIVFCKYENFLAHKKHYCASRPPPDGGDGDADKTSPEGSPGPKPLTVSSPQSSKDSVSPTPVLKPPMIQFICSTCGVKFSSFDNLTTHQTFYCPNRTAVALQEPAADNKAAPPPTPSKCPKCKVSVSSSGYFVCDRRLGGGGGGQNFAAQFSKVPAPGRHLRYCFKNFPTLGSIAPVFRCETKNVVLPTLFLFVTCNCRVIVCILYFYDAV